MKILFVSRAYPPVVGGMETQNYELSIWLEKYAQLRTIANKRGKRFLPVFLPYATVRAIVLAKYYEAVLLGDGVLAVVGYFLKLFYPNKPVISVVHGLDLTYGFWPYRTLWVRIFLKKLDRLIAVSNETARLGAQHGIPEKIFSIIPNGIDPDNCPRKCSRGDLKKSIGIDLDDKKILLTHGRLAKRKGVVWFIHNVMPQLDENIIYLIAGQGSEQKNIEKEITMNHLENRVCLLGYVSDEVRNILLNTSDIFIQPNIKVKDDIEGFGISVVEAASCELPVVASNLEGLKDAIKNNENGFLVEPYDANGYIKKINELLTDDRSRKKFGEKARQYVVEHYSWEVIAKKYIEEIKNVIRNS